MAHEVVRFIAPEGEIQVDVRVDPETVWLSLDQIGELFQRHKSTISRHLKNVFAGRSWSVQQLLQRAQQLPRTAKPTRWSTSTSMRSSRSATASTQSEARNFAKWASRVLKEHLVQKHKQRSDEAALVAAGLKNIELLARSGSADGLETDEVLSLIERYARSWHLLLQYDEKRLPVPPEQASKKLARLTYRQASKAVEQFKKSLMHKGQATDLFGKDRSTGLESILGNLEQTWGGVPVYPNVELRAAHLLYFVIKNHPFYDGNKRIGSFLFIHFLAKNKRPLLAGR